MNNGNSESKKDGTNWLLVGSIGGGVGILILCFLLSSAIYAAFFGIPFKKKILRVVQKKKSPKNVVKKDNENKTKEKDKKKENKDDFANIKDFESTIKDIKSDFGSKSKFTSLFVLDVGRGEPVDYVIKSTIVLHEEILFQANHRPRLNTIPHHANMVEYLDSKLSLSGFCVCFEIKFVNYCRINCRYCCDVSKRRSKKW